MNTMNHLARVLFRTSLMAAVLLLIAAPTFAYEEDTHFLMTYVICKSVGFTDEEALTVAAVDQGMDDSQDTNAHDGVVPQITEEWMWHALDRDGKMHASGVLARRDVLFKDAINEKDPKNRLIRLGIFFHFQQDTWAHRHHERSDHLSRTNYTTYNTPTGHGPWGGQPDRPPLDPIAALMNLEDGIIYASEFMDKAYKRPVTPFMSGYVSAGGIVDANWKDKKQGKFFNSLDVSNISPDTARMFVGSLIRAQIDVYPQNISPSPFYFRKQTADRADFDDVRSALQKVCDQYKKQLGPIKIPSRKDKESAGFTEMTTTGLQSLGPGGKMTPATKPLISTPKFNK